MTVLSAQTIRRLGIITPFHERTVYKGSTFGLSTCGYDIRVGQSVTLSHAHFVLVSSLEHFNMPMDVVGVVHDKSTWARRGIAVQNTVIEPNWRGYLTLEISAHAFQSQYIEEGMPIAQIIFHKLDEPTDQPYVGKYQDQPTGPVPAKDYQ